MHSARKCNPLPWLLLAVALVAAWMLWPTRGPAPSPTSGVTATTPTSPSPPPLAEAPTNQQRALPEFLPPEAHRTIDLIQRGGPFPHPQDGSAFGNRESHLPPKPRGWYREFTVDTPGLSHRGARRIITGGQPPQEWYYTDDHYDSFRRFDVAGAAR